MYEENDENSSGLVRHRPGHSRSSWLAQLSTRTLAFILIVSALTGGCAPSPTSDDPSSTTSEPTWAEDIAPIVFENCVPCHRAGQPGPFLLTSYKDVAKRSKMVAHVTRTRYMPPWPADHTYRSFLGEKVLTDEQIDLIQRWHVAGAPKGDMKLEPELPNYPEGSQLGEPDLVLYVEPYLVPGTNRDEFLIMKVPYEMEEERYVKAAEFIPGPNQLVHHMNGHLIKYEEAKKSDVFAGEYVVDSELFTDDEIYRLMDIPNDDGSFPVLDPLVVNYLPGVIASIYPQGIGGFKMSKKGAFMIHDMHYAPIPKEAWDSSRINIFFTDEPPTRPTYEIQMGTYGISRIVPDFIIPPDTVMTFHTKAEVEDDISLLTINPHMHLLGRDFWAFALEPSGDTIPLIKIPEWDFHWQYFYTFERMQKIPKGSVIHVYATFDNTVNNPENPFNPPRRIDAQRNTSMRTTDEMLQFIMTYLSYEEGDESISLK